MFDIMGGSSIWDLSELAVRRSKFVKAVQLMGEERLQH